MKRQPRQRFAEIPCTRLWVTGSGFPCKKCERASETISFCFKICHPCLSRVSSARRAIQFLTESGDVLFLGGLLRQGPFSPCRGGSLDALSFNILTLSNQSPQVLRGWRRITLAMFFFIIILLPSRATEIQIFNLVSTVRFTSSLQSCKYGRSEFFSRPCVHSFLWGAVRNWIIEK